jgi:protoporphyrinogen oxidase
MDKIDNIILGAGPSGLAAGFELNKAKKTFIVFEKDAQVGGLAKTLDYGEFRTDIGPHRFFSHNPYLYNLIGDILGEQWKKVNRLTRFMMKGKFFLYPIDLKNVVLNLGVFRGLRIVIDYLKELFRKQFNNVEYNSFEDIVVAQFGRSLAELNMLNYTEKIWGLPCSLISTDWFNQRIKGLSIRSIIEDILLSSTEGPKTLVDQFYYPETGASLIYEKMAEIINEDDNGKVKISSYPVEIKHNNEKIIEVTVEEKGKRETYQLENLISSIPWVEVLKIFNPSPPEEVMNALKKLKFRSHVTVFITLDYNQVFEDQWLYFPEKEIPFGRIMEPKNFSSKLSPEGKTSLMVEYFCWKGDKIWNLGKKELFELTVKWLERINFIKKDKIIEYHTHREEYAYPVYDIYYQKHREIVRTYLEKFQNLLLIGRAGNFRYNNQDHALEMGILAARSIIEEKKYDLETIGIEQEYFEKGYIENNTLMRKN